MRAFDVLRDLGGFDTLAAVLFDHEYRVSRAALIPNEVVRNRSKHVQHDNKWNFILSDDVWDEEGVSDVTEVLKTTWNQLCSMDKRSSMERVNAALGHELLNRDNTHFSNVNAKKPA